VLVTTGFIGLTELTEIPVPATMVFTCHQEIRLETSSNVTLVAKDSPGFWTAIRSVNSATDGSSCLLLFNEEINLLFYPIITTS